MKESLPESGKIETVKRITEDYIERNLKDANVEKIGKTFFALLKKEASGMKDSTLFNDRLL